MAADANGVVTLERLKSELRIESTETAHDSLLAEQRADAISLTESYLRRPLIDRTRTIRTSAMPEGSTSPLRLRSLPGFKSLARIKYWQDSQTRRDEPSGVILPAALGRTEQVDGVVEIHPQADGWPAYGFAEYRVEAVTGWQEIPSALRSAVVVLVRQLYNGYREMRADAAFYALISGHRVRTPAI